VAESTGKLIERLVAESGPVRRLRPPVVRASFWLLAVMAAGVAAIAVFADLGAFSSRLVGSLLWLEWPATLLTGIAAIVAAFQLSMPDRSAAWALLPLPPLALWIGTSGYSCFKHWIVAGPGGWELGESANCFIFILLFSLPLALSLLVLLRRAAPLTPVRVAVVGALGVSALAAAALQFFHPFDVTFMDLGVHLGAVALVVLGAAAIEYLSAGSHLQRPA
jgi:hypothetical protein